MTPSETADFLQQYGWIGISVVLGVVVGLLALYIKGLWSSREEAQIKHAEALLHEAGKVYAALQASKTSIDALNLSIEARNPLTAVLAESNKAIIDSNRAIAEAIRGFGESIARLDRALAEQARQVAVILDRLQRAERG